MRTEEFWIGYCVGLYEGEGTVNIHSKPKNRIYPRLVIRMTDREPVEVMQRIFGGTVHGPYSSPSEAAKGYKPKYRWTLAQVDEVVRVATLMLEALSPRRRAQLEAALALVTPRIEQVAVAGNRRDGTLPPLRARKTGQLVCPAEPEPSARGYLRHKRLGVPVCEVCRASYNLWAAARRVWYADKIAVTNREQYVKNRDARVAKQRAYNLTHRDEINARQRAYSARKRLERQTQTSTGSASPPSEMPSA